ncbi:MAG: hypothetical protein M1832_001701 [Thelocarpon impressellum]|nr:MAG: hypothetical protein M1832_001701 [Thelocarpon impressellum]
MSAVTAYTALEILLLCQSLARLGTDPASFSRISDALKSNALVREAKAFDIGRLSPDALRELYLNLLKDEESTDGGANGTPGGAGPNGQAGPQDPTSSAGSRKRKIPSPLPGGTQDASSLSHLVDRLYNRYKDYIIRSIREDETRYKHLRRDIQEIEHGHWDDRLSKQAVMLERDPKTDEVRAITRVKHEQPSTPVGTLADAENEMGGETTADESVQAGSRRGGGVEKPEERHATGKRKRDRAETPDTMDVISPGHDSAASHTGPRYIMSTPNFPRTTAPVLNDISGHKYASLFAAPVKEKDAPGYRDLIYQPQDLKSIKTAIAAGGRAVVAAGGVAGTPTEGVESPGPGVSTPGKNSSILVTRGPDVVPPKGIVNSAQFEREVMRMFANAVMFNHDPDRGFGPAFRERSENAEDGDEGTSAADAEEEAAGRVVQDTRKMFEAVEKTVTDWRAAERSLKHLPV